MQCNPRIQVQLFTLQPNLNVNDEDELRYYHTEIGEYQLTMS